MTVRHLCPCVNYPHLDGKVPYTGVVPYFGVNKKGHKRKRDNAVALYPGRHEPIVDQETYERCQRIRELMGCHPRSRPDTMERIYTLSGILTCGYCGQPMRGQSGNGTRYYRDKSRVLHRADCPQPYVHADEIEEQFAQLLQSIQLPPDWREKVVAALHPELNADEIRERKEEIQARLERAKRLYIDGDIDRGQYEGEKLTCQARLADLQPANYCDILAVGQILENAEDWHNSDRLTKKERSKQLFTTVLIRGTQLQAAKPTEACFALIQHSVGLRDFLSSRGSHRISGSDGGRISGRNIGRPEDCLRAGFSFPSG